MSGIDVQLGYLEELASEVSRHGEPLAAAGMTAASAEVTDRTILGHGIDTQRVIDEWNAAVEHRLTDLRNARDTVGLVHAGLEQVIELYRRMDEEQRERILSAGGGN